MSPWRRRLGPALSAGSFPLFGMTVSTVGHVVTITAVLLLAGVWGQWNASKVYVVNLVPAVSIMGSPLSRSTVPSLPPRPAVTEPQRQTPEAVAKAAPAAPKPADLPLPEPRAAKRPPTLPRPGEKELPSLAASAERRSAATPAPARSENPGSSTEARTSVPPIPLGRPDGSPTGVASLALEVSDFPFTWYLRLIQQKVTEKWVQPSRATEAGLRVVVLFEIARDGQVTSPKVEKSSGNAWYDQSALRAVIEANPFPQLPEGFPGQSLRVHFGFDFKPS